jgi:hypothetical protein
MRTEDAAGNPPKRGVLNIMKGSGHETSTTPVSSTAKKEKRVKPDTAGLTERRVVTPRSDLIVVRVEEASSKRNILNHEKASTLIAKIATATRKPGAERAAIFRSRIGKKVYAYSVCPTDLSKIVREDVEGNRMVGHLVNGRFRALHSVQKDLDGTLAASASRSDTTPHVS